MKKIELTEEELKLVCEALLFGSAIEMCADWDDFICKKLMDLGLRLIKENEVVVENVYYYCSSEESEQSEQSFSLRIKHELPEIVQFSGEVRSKAE